MRSVIANDTDHFIEFGADLYAAGESAIRRLSIVYSEHSILLESKSLIAFLVPRIWDDDLALST
jgi:hypothetical protein